MYKDQIKTPPTQLAPISDAEFLMMRDLIQNRFGINLTDQKRSLLVTRLHKYVQEVGFTSFQQYMEYIKRDQSGNALKCLADLISTNHTFFFRESKHFDFMRETALPQITQALHAEKCSDLRIWCAAASTGEEPYGLMITLMEFLGNAYQSWNAGLLATDLSQEALMTAVKGIYEKEKITGIPSPLLHKYFQETPEGAWEARPKLKQEITFRRFNLIRSQFPFKKPFHIIFCRNVMIYFDQPTIQDLVNRFYQWIAPGGYLFVGFSESLGRINHQFQYVQPAIYQKV